MYIKWYGTASLGIKSGDKRLLIDPFFNRNPELPCAQPEDFAEYDAILLTHGHYDHLADVPGIVSQSGARVFCTATPAGTLIKAGVSPENIKIITPGARLSINGFSVEVYKSKHVVFDVGTIIRHAVSFDFYRHLPTSLKLISTAFTMPEAGEIVGYHIHADGDDAFVLGSLNYDKRISYPRKVGTLIVPYNGCSSLEKTALAITEMFSPERVLLDHYDDAFPPITQQVDTESFLRLMHSVHPEITTECLSFSS